MCHSWDLKTALSPKVVAQISLLIMQNNNAHKQHVYLTGRMQANTGLPCEQNPDIKLKIS